jgi:hypothetical protein
VLHTGAYGTTEVQHTEIPSGLQHTHHAELLASAATTYT